MHMKKEINEFGGHFLPSENFKCLTCELFSIENINESGRAEF